MEGGKWIIGMFLLMMLGVMSYLFITGEFLNGGTPLPFVTAIADELGITVHDIGFFVAIAIIGGIAFIGIPLLILVVRLAE